MEVNLSNLLAAAVPRPVYKDENITLYGIPVVPQPSSSPETVEISLNEHNKRKRSPSPDTSSKRKAVQVASSSETRKLESRAYSKDFDPRTLVGEEAHRWRELNIYTMFSRPKPPAIKKGKKATEAPKPSTSKASGADSTAPDSEQPRSHGLPHKQTQLPTFKHDPGQEKSTLCYVCVGPRQRGKFDAKKAEEMGVPHGPLRANLARGQTVVYTVNDPELGPVERTVRPEELLGPSEIPKVTTASSCYLTTH